MITELKADIKECVRMNDKFLYPRLKRKLAIKYVIRRAFVLFIICGGVICAGYWIMMLFLNWVVTL